MKIHFIFAYKFPTIKLQRITISPFYLQQIIANQTSLNVIQSHSRTRAIR